MALNTEKTVRELAVENPHATRVFEEYGIDYCCGGGRTLSAACAEKGVLVEEVRNAISSHVAQDVERQAAKNWNHRELSVLIDHIVATHHLYVRQETVRIQQMLAKVAGKHGVKHPEIIRIQGTFDALSQELTSHLMKEENILFPYIIELESTTAGGRPKPRPMFGSVKSPIHMMELEHASAGEALKSLRTDSNDYSAPEDACTTFQATYLALRAFEADLHQHIHLENNILFPMAIALETSAPAV